MIKIPISVGELIDKITILHIKTLHSNNEYIHKELKKLTQIAKDHNVFKPNYIFELSVVNQQLWDVEEKIRKKESAQEFDQEFIDLSRTIYKTNDLRAEIKRKINEETGSKYKEIKLYDQTP
jgi:hypothetical protein